MTTVTYDTRPVYYLNVSHIQDAKRAAEHGRTPWAGYLPEEAGHSYRELVNMAKHWDGPHGDGFVVDELGVTTVYAKRQLWIDYEESEDPRHTHDSYSYEQESHDREREGGV